MRNELGAIALIALFVTATPANAQSTDILNYSETNYTRYARTKGSQEVVHFLPHPPGCPRRAFCACGASVRIFGSAIRALWSTVAWLKFPRAAPAPTRVAVKPGHLFVLDSHVSGSNWWVYDYNSGGHKSRYWIRSIVGYTIVNPYGNKLALN